MPPVSPAKSSRFITLLSEVAAVLVCPFDPKSPASLRSASCHLGSAVLLLVLGVFAASRALPEFLQAARARFWPTAPGVVVSSHVVEASAGRASTLRPKLALGYRFEVDGRSFEGSRLSFGADAGPATFDFARSAATRYPARSRVDVRFNPADPSDCVLEAKAAGAAWVFALVATAGLALGGLWMMEGVRILRESTTGREMSQNPRIS
jgi:hypothetical protein